jgi:Holliday junction resolvase-like predicted endonuclease
MNLTDEQKQSLNTLPVGSAVVRLADEHPEAFLVRIPLCRIKEGCISDTAVKKQMAGYYTDSSSNGISKSLEREISPVPPLDRNNEIYDKTSKNNTHPPTPKESEDKKGKVSLSCDSESKPATKNLSREEIRFLADIAFKPLSSTVSRYHRLNLSRRRGNAIRQHLSSAGIIERVTIATRSGQVVLYRLTNLGRSVCASAGIESGSRSRESLEHRYWVNKTAQFFERQGYKVNKEHPVKGNGAIDLLAQKSGEQIAIEIETGKSDIKSNLKNITKADFARTIVLATSAEAVKPCQKAIDSMKENDSPKTELLSWLDIS